MSTQDILSAQSEDAVFGDAAFSNWEKEGEGGIPKGKPSAVVGFSGMTGFGIYNSLTSQSGSILQNHRVVWEAPKVLPIPTPAMGFIRRISKDNINTFINIFL